MPMNKFLYFGDFAVIPVATFLFAYLTYRRLGIDGAPEFLAAALFGATLWTLVEYFVHRYAYHHAPVLSRMHDEHHKKPNEMIGVPSFVSSGLVIGVCYFPLAAFYPVLACGFASGMLIGYAAYMFVHHATHHLAIAPDSWLYRARVRHMVHHYRDNTNFGVTTGFWDWVFRTERMPSGRFPRR